MVAILAACGGGGGGSASDGPPPSSTVGQVTNSSLKSNANGFIYPLQVFVPHSYATGSATLPVIYATEGDAPFGGNGVTRFDAFRKIMERRGTQAILVGIGGTQRRATDFLFPGADSYLQFITHDLAPAIERQYRADPRRRALSGLSHGGYFVVAALVIEGRAGGPPSFSHYLSTDSSYGGHANPAEYRLFEKQLDGKPLATTLLLAASTRANGPAVVNDLYAQMAAQTNPGLTLIKTDFETGHVESDAPAFEDALARFFP